MDSPNGVDAEIDAVVESPTKSETATVVENDFGSSINDSILEMPKIDCSSSDINHDDNSLVSCGRCKKMMSHVEYIEKHRQIHYNLCWIDGEEKLDYSDEKKIVFLLRQYLPTNAERRRLVSLKCDWCQNIFKSVVGYARHVNKCIPEIKMMTAPSERIDERLISELPNVTCGCCHQDMSLTEYKKVHCFTHYNLSWLNGEKLPDFDDEKLIQRLLRQSVTKLGLNKNKVNFTCEWCQTEKRSIAGFSSHIKRCEKRPDVLYLSKNTNSTNSVILNENLESLVICGRCKKEMTLKDYHNKHCSEHYNLCWIEGEEKIDLENYEVVLSKLRQFIPFHAVKKRGVNLICEECSTVKKSLPGFASHVIFCNKNPRDALHLFVSCELCHAQVKPSSLPMHKIKNCKGLKVERIDRRSTAYNQSRRKRRPPNVLSFHPDNTYASEYYDFVCRLCNLSSLSINDVSNHILTVHNIDVNNTKSGFSLNDYIINTFENHRSLYLKPLLNYYNFFKNIFWTANYYEDFQPNTILLNSDEALNYLPSVQQSCKVFNSSDEEILVDLFKSTNINGIQWLFTGGPIWALSWCPVPAEVQKQYLAIACHPKPDLEHEETKVYKYSSLLQLWTFNSLNNINSDSACDDVPFMSYGLAHDFGAVWDMAWCPSGAYEPDKKIGLLALSTSSGDCPIYAMPYVDGNSKMFYIYKSKPVIARNIQCEWNKVGVQCTKVCWKAVAPFNILICGYSNGMVSVFNINFKTIFFNDDILYPSHTFRASKCNITGLSINYLNSSILATTSADGYVILWDLKSTENPLFKKNFCYPSDCAWLHQCYSLVICTRSIKPLYLKLQTINFANYDDDFDDYKPELYVLESIANSTKVINDCIMINNTKQLTFDPSYETTDKNKIDAVEKNSTFNDSNINSDNESLNSVGSNESCFEERFDSGVKFEDSTKVEVEDLFGPYFFHKCAHWSVSGSNWMNVIATGNCNGAIYEKSFLPETNQMRKEVSTVLQLIVKKLSSNDSSNLEYSNGYCYKETVKEFALESKFSLSDENTQNNSDDDKQLLRYPIDNITKVSWNQNMSSFRWLAIGTQSGFTLISPSQSLPSNCYEMFQKIILDPSFNEKFFVS